MKKFWRIWKYSLGSFSDDKTKPYDNYVACVRTVIFVSYMLTNCAIIANAVRHWDNVGTNVYICADKPNGGYWCTKR